MEVQARAEIVTHVKVHGCVTKGPPATNVEPGEGFMVDVDTVYEIDDDGKTISANLGASLTAQQLEQVEDALIDAFIATHE